VCQSVPDCVRLCQGLFFKLNDEFEHRPCLAHELTLILRSVQPSGYARPIVYDPDSAVPTGRDLLFLSFKTTETSATSCAKLVWLSDCSKVFKRSRAQAAIAPQEKGDSHRTRTFHPINPSTENPQNTHDHVWNSNYPCAPANAFPSSCRIPIPFRHCLNQSTQMVPDACDSVRVLGVFRTMHETTSRFAAQLHRIFGCSSIAESSP